MKVIDLLNRIANGEEVPKKIKYFNGIYTLRDEKDDYANDNGWFTDLINLLDLNEEVEIEEEDKKIERITNKAFLNSPFGELVGGKFNEIIDAINEMREDK